MWQTLLQDTLLLTIQIVTDRTRRLWNLQVLPYSRKAVLKVVDIIITKASHYMFLVIIGSYVYLCSYNKLLCIWIISPAVQWEVIPVAPGIYQTLQLVIFHHAVFNSIQNVLIQRRGEPLCLDTSSESLVSEHHGARPWPNPGAAQMACLF